MKVTLEEGEDATEYVRDVIWVRFHPGTSREQIHYAIRLVDGEVVGGCLSPGRIAVGRYWLRLPSPNTVAEYSPDPSA